MATTPDSGQLLTMLLKLANTKKTIEIGVFTVYSLLLTALSIPDDGKPENEGCFDFAYVNSENYHERLMKLEKIDGVVVYDNVLRRGFVAMPEELLSGEKWKHERHWAIELNNHLATDPKFYKFNHLLGNEGCFDFAYVDSDKVNSKNYWRELSNEISIEICM
uniref:Caffeoyl-CoA O-methyltransferase n=1 Tax=Vitis vinifera TaxID=29760 RepID=A5BG21_VITVI|nr:hypothetical protein VITISV_006635 [Vitis vinifera]